jgi:hypothetical protein
MQIIDAEGGLRPGSVIMLELVSCQEANGPLLQHSEGIKHLQKIVRKVQHVLLVKRRVDTLRSHACLSDIPKIIETT